MFIKRDKKSAVVIGGANIDIKGRPKKVLIPYTSNPGEVEVTVGGVSRNIAENLARLKINTTLLTAVGMDEYGRLIVEKTSETGVNMNHVICSPEMRTGRFLAIINNKRDLEVAITDMDILSLITPEYIEAKIDLIKEAAIVVIDVDIPHDTLEYIADICQKYSIPLCAEPVSVTKTAFVKDMLDKITIITPNKDEAEVLVDSPIEDLEGVMKAGQTLLDRGIKMAVITLGPEGVYVVTKEEQKFIPSIAAVVVDAIGAGDALVGGMIYGLIKGQSPAAAIGSGVASATITLKSRKAVSPDLSPEKLEHIYKELVYKKMARQNFNGAASLEKSKENL